MPGPSVASSVIIRVSGSIIFLFSAGSQLSATRPFCQLLISSASTNILLRCWRGQDDDHPTIPSSSTLLTTPPHHKLLSSASHPPGDIEKLIKVHWTLAATCCWWDSLFVKQNHISVYKPRLWWRPQSKPFSPHHNKSSYSDTTTPMLSPADWKGGWHNPCSIKRFQHLTVLLYLKLLHL